MNYLEQTPVSTQELLEAAAHTVMQRGQDYDAPQGERSMARTVRIFNAIVGREAINEREGWLFMIALKLARSQQGASKPDTYVDLSAYAALAGECAINQQAHK